MVMAVADNVAIAVHSEAFEGYKSLIKKRSIWSIGYSGYCSPFITESGYDYLSTSNIKLLSAY